MTGWLDRGYSWWVDWLGDLAPGMTWWLAFPAFVLAVYALVAIGVALARGLAQRGLLVTALLVMGGLSLLFITVDLAAASGMRAIGVRPSRLQYRWGDAAAAVMRTSHPYASAVANGFRRAADRISKPVILVALLATIAWWNTNHCAGADPRSGCTPPSVEWAQSVNASGRELWDRLG